MGLEKRRALVAPVLAGDGTLATMQARILGLAEEHGMSQWPYGDVDGSFSPWPRRR
jgi:hypothetical protein